VENLDSRQGNAGQRGGKRPNRTDVLAAATTSGGGRPLLRVVRVVRVGNSGTGGAECP
jgi:hypothetical protein